MVQPRWRSDSVSRGKGRERARSARARPLWRGARRTEAPREAASLAGPQDRVAGDRKIAASGSERACSRAPHARARNQSKGRRLLFAVCLLLSTGAWSSSAADLQFHVHGLGYSGDGAGLLVATAEGLLQYRDGQWSRVPGEPVDLKGFAVTSGALYASGQHADGKPLGLACSRDGGATWTPILLGGDASFAIVAAGYRSQAIYFFSSVPVPRIPVPGLHVTPDRGGSWHRVSAGGISGRILSLAAHPVDPRVLAAGTTTGLFVSRDGGERFRRIARGGAVSAVAFEPSGRELLYAFAYSSKLIAVKLEGRGRRQTALAVARTDFVDYIVTNPADPRILALATRWHDIFLSTNGGATWHRIAQNGRDARDESDDSP